MSVVYSVCEDAEVNPAGQSLHEKRSQTVPALLDAGNGKLVCSVNLNYVLTGLHIEEQLSLKHNIVKPVRSM